MKKIGTEDCYLALLAIHEESYSKMRIFKKNSDLKRWLADRPLLTNDTKNIGMKATRRIFWLLSAVNGFIKRENKKIIISEWGYKFLWADEFKKPEIFKESREANIDGYGQPRYRKAVIKIIGKGYRLGKYKGKRTGYCHKYTKAGWIYEFLHTVFDEERKLNSNSFAFMRAEQEGDWHEHSRTTEIFIFTSGRGHFEIGVDGDIIKVPVNDDWALIVEAGVPHKIVPAIMSSVGGYYKRYLTAIVYAYPGWESEYEYRIGESKVRYDGPAE